MKVQRYRRNPIVGLFANEDCMDMLKVLCRWGPPSSFTTTERRYLRELSDLSFVVLDEPAGYDRKATRIKEITPAGLAAVRLLP